MTSQLTTSPYTYAEVRGPVTDPAVRASFEVSATASVPAMLLDAAKSEAAAAGYAAGWAQGMRAAQEQSAADVRASRSRLEQQDRDRAAGLAIALAALDRAAAAVESHAVASVEQLEDTLLTIGIELAEALLERELRLSGTGGRDALARVLRLAPTDESVLVRLSPTDHATLLADANRPAPNRRQITLQPDPSLASGDAIATCGATEIDARLSAGLARVKAVLAQ